VDTLDTSEEAGLALVAERAGITNTPLTVLDMGCGWGSATLYLASHFPRINVVSVSNSASQREYIMGQARARGLTNVTVHTSDINVFDTDVKFDR